MSNRLGGKQGTAYTGTNANQPPNWTFNDRPPTQYDNQNVSEGDLWLDSSAAGLLKVWILVSLAGNSMSKGSLAEWVQFGVGNLEFLTGNSGGPVGPDAFDNINVVGDGITIDVTGNAGTHTLTISAIGTGLLQTLTGNSGTAHPVGGNINIVTAHATPKFVGAADTLTQDFGLTNLLLGSSGPSLTGFASANVGYGNLAGNSISVGANNCYIGSGSGLNAGTSDQNSCLGAFSMHSDVGGSTDNVAIGYLSLWQLSGGADNNVAVGSRSGSAYTTTESNNITIGNIGVIGDSGATRIGTNGTQTKAFMAGVAGVTVANQLEVVIDSVTGQLGTISGTPASQVAFGAYKSADSNNVTGDGTFYQVICDGELYDLDNNYDPITGIFTAPTDGTYHFDTYIACHNIADQNLSALNIETTNVIFHSDLQSPVINKSIDNILHFQLSVDINMNAGNTALIKIALGGGSGAKVVGVTGAIPPGSPVATYFSGHRLDPAASFITGAETFVTDAGTATPNISGVVNVLAQNATLGCGSSVVISAPGSSNTIQLDVTDALGNTIIGANSGNLTLTSTHCVALGDGCGSSLTSGKSNIFIGYQAGSAITTGDGNLIIGDASLTTGLNGSAAVNGYYAFGASVGTGGTPTLPFLHNYGGNQAGNTFLGYNSGSFNAGQTSANRDNTGVGQQSLNALTTGTSNACLGYQSGYFLTSGSGNTLLGRDAGASYVGAESGNICIGNGVVGVAGESNKTKIGGIRGATTTNNDAVAVLIDSAGQLGTVSSSMRFKSNIEPMGSVSDRLMDLEPVTFSWKEDQSYRQQLGLIAEQVEQVFPELVVHDKEGLPETVKYHELPVLLLNELKKLSARVAELEKLLK